MGSHFSNIFILKIFSLIMAKEGGINLPPGFGGLVNYKEEYSSKFMLKPTHVIGFVIFIVLVRIGLGYIFG
jgi:preprotein translocase subunit Sec61beta